MNKLFNIKTGTRVHVDFISESATDLSNTHFVGDGVIDRAEDGRIFGRLDNGTPFMCDEFDATVIEYQSKRKAFEVFIGTQPFYLQLKFRHGDYLFDFDEGIGYRNQNIQIAYVCWCKGDVEFVI